MKISTLTMYILALVEAIEEEVIVINEKDTATIVVEITEVEDNTEEENNIFSYR